MLEDASGRGHDSASERPSPLAGQRTILSDSQMDNAIASDAQSFSRIMSLAASKGVISGWWGQETTNEIRMDAMRRKTIALTVVRVITHLRT